MNKRRKINKLFRKANAKMMEEYDTYQVENLNGIATIYVAKQNDENIFDTDTNFEKSKILLDIENVYTVEQEKQKNEQESEQIVDYFKVKAQQTEISKQENSSELDIVKNQLKSMFDENDDLSKTIIQLNENKPQIAINTRNEQNERQM